MLAYYRCLHSCKLISKFNDVALHHKIGTSRVFGPVTIMRINAPKKTSIKSSRWHLYILRCNDNTFYTGITNDVQRRLKMHNDGKASRYTRSRRPVILIYQERCRNKSSALKKECKVKFLSRKGKEEYIMLKTRILDRNIRES